MVQHALEHREQWSEPVVQKLRYALSFAKLMTIRNVDGVDVDVAGLHHRCALDIEEMVREPIENEDVAALHEVCGALADKVRRSRSSLLEHLPLDRDSLEEEVTQRKLAVVSGGGGGAGYVYNGCYQAIERAGLIPDMMVGTSIGAFMSIFRARRRAYDFAPLVEAARKLSWSNVFRVLDTDNHYGIPATMRLYLRPTLGGLFQSEEGEGLRLSELEIPLYVVITGITLDAMKHDLAYYEHLLETSSTSRRVSVRGIMKVVSVLKEFLVGSDSLVEIVAGRTSGTEHFDVLDAAGFSAAIPGLIHYDVLRADARMTKLLDDLYAEYGITRLGEGGMVSNVPARVAWESVVSGTWGRRNVFVLGLDCFSPNKRFDPLVPPAAIGSEQQCRGQ